MRQKEQEKDEKEGRCMSERERRGGEGKSKRDEKGRSDGRRRVTHVVMVFCAALFSLS